MFLDYFKDIYSSEVNVRKANRLYEKANDLELTFIIGINSKRFYTKQHDERDYFNFRVVKFLFFSSNIPSDP